jgi:beta-lactam-binding protein with PASTA domain
MVVGVCALAAAGCGTATSPAAQGDARVAVPALRHATLRDATCRLRDMGLRWRQHGEQRAHTRQLSGCGSDGVGSSADDDHVTGQAPPPGTRVPRGTVIVLDTECSDLVRAGGGACS